MIIELIFLGTIQIIVWTTTAIVTFLPSTQNKLHNNKKCELPPYNLYGDYPPNYDYVISPPLYNIS